jgi:hypothetical protein
MQYQARLQLAQQAPQLYDMGKLHRQMLEVLGIQDAADIVKLPDEIKPADPVTENMSMLKQEPVKAFMYQDHAAHIRVHMSAMQDPNLCRACWSVTICKRYPKRIGVTHYGTCGNAVSCEIQKMLGVELPDEEAATARRY